MCALVSAPLSQGGRVVLFHLLLVGGAVSQVYLYIELFSWIRPFGWPLGGQGVHGGFAGGPRILAVPVIALGFALLVTLCGSFLLGRTLGKRFLMLAMAATCLCYLLFLDQSLFFGLILRPLRLGWLVNVPAGVPLWQLRSAIAIAFWWALELAFLAEHGFKRTGARL